MYDDDDHAIEWVKSEADLWINIESWFDEHLLQVGLVFLSLVLLEVRTNSRARIFSTMLSGSDVTKTIQRLLM